MKICKNGHRYDEMQYDRCPQCEIENESRTMAFTSNGNAGNYTNNNRNVYGASRGGYYDSYGNTMYESRTYLDDLDDDQGMHTVGVYEKVKGFDPVVGWLVCVEGASKGKDFRIHAERNFIGRGSSSDICILGDNTISERMHAVISFNPKENIFRINPGEARGIIYLNDNEVFNAEVLKKGDVIQIGQTHLMFIPLCDDSFSW